MALFGVEGVIHLDHLIRGLTKRLCGLERLEDGSHTWKETLEDDSLECLFYKDANIQLTSDREFDYLGDHDRETHLYWLMGDISDDIDLCQRLIVVELAKPLNPSDHIRYWQLALRWRLSGDISEYLYDQICANVKPPTTYNGEEIHWRAGIEAEPQDLNHDIALCDTLLALHDLDAHN